MPIRGRRHSVGGTGRNQRSGRGNATTGRGNGSRRLPQAGGRRPPPSGWEPWHGPAPVPEPPQPQARRGRDGGQSFIDWYDMYCQYLPGGCENRPTN